VPVLDCPVCERPHLRAAQRPVRRSETSAGTLCAPRFSLVIHG
jgi:hypothetical protein